MDSQLNDQAMNVAINRLEQARILSNKVFAIGAATEKPELLLACAQLLATEYNTLQVQRLIVSVCDGVASSKQQTSSAVQAAVNDLKSYLHNDF
jgi:hypothetical protein